MTAHVLFGAALLSTALVSAASVPAQPPQQRPPAADQAGYQLLEHLVGAVAGAVKPGSVQVDISQDVVQLARDLKAAREARKVDEIFAVRYSRLLSAIRQGVLKDPEVLYWPMYRATMLDFIEERTGRRPDWNEVLTHVNNHGGSGVGLALLADAIMAEVVSLHLHLDTSPQRADVLKRYLERTTPRAARAATPSPQKKP